MELIKVKPIDVGSNKYDLMTYGIKFYSDNPDKLQYKYEGTLPNYIKVTFEDDYEDDILKELYLSELIITPYSMYFKHIDGEWFNNDYRFLKIINRNKSSLFRGIRNLRNIALIIKNINYVELTIRAKYVKVFDSYHIAEGYILDIAENLSNKESYRNFNKLELGEYNVFKQE